MSSKRIFTAAANDTGEIHSLGNGDMVIYEQGPNIIDVFSPYSSPSHFKLAVGTAGGVWETTRERYTCIFSHSYIEDQKEKISMTDFPSVSRPLFLRKINAMQEATFTLSFKSSMESFVTNKYEKYGYTGVFFELPSGSTILYRCSPLAVYGYVLIENKNARFTKIGMNQWQITVKPGETHIIATGDYDTERVEKGMTYAMNSSYDSLITETRNRWKSYADIRKADENEPEYIDSAFVGIKTQQSVSGGLPSCNVLPFGYSRDDYGASRAFLTLGYYTDARRVLDFRYNKWLEFGEIKNAEGMGISMPRHFSENEELEQTSYTVLSARDYYNKVYDDTYIHTIFPMLLWCVNCQIPYINNGMVPFNGDETYIAGAILGRVAINHGAAEATMMFIECAQWVYEWGMEHGRTREVFGLDKIVKSVKEKYRENFYINGTFYANNPERAKDASFHDTAIGVCVEHDYAKKIGKPMDPPDFVGMLLNDGKGHYVCTRCYDKGGYSGPEIPATEVGAVLLTPLYLGSDIFTKEELYQFAKRYMEFPRQSIIVTGHEPSLLLYTLLRTGGTREEIDFARDLVMKYKSSLGVWDEYYFGDISRATRNRPWETGYALEALMLYDEMYGQRK